MPSAPVDGPPLDPSSPEARQWVLDELAKGRYTTEPSPWQRFVEWLQELFSGQPGSALLPSWAVVVVVVVLLGVVALVVLRLVRAEPGTRRGRDRSVLDDEGISAAAYRARARDARSRGDWDAVLLDSYRALATSAVERTLLTDLPGRTAHEVAVALEPVFPRHADALAASAAEFDAVRYGHTHTSQALAEVVAELDSALLAARPTLGELVGR